MNKSALSIVTAVGSIAAVSVFAASSAAFAASVPASAVSHSPNAVTPASAQGCNGDTCFYLAGNAGGDILVQGWAFTATFTGYFVLQGPNFQRTSPTKKWVGKKGNYWSTSVSTSKSQAGQWCLTGHTSSGADEGTECHTLTT
jgi:hypothetical protein